MTRGEKIKKAREHMGLSQTALADKINVSKQTMYKYENNIVTNIPTDKIEAIALACHCTPEYLMGWEDEETNIVPLHPDIKEAEEKPSARQVMIATIDKLSDSEKTHWTALMREYLQSKQGNH